MTFAEIVLLIAIIGLILLLALGGVGYILFQVINKQSGLIKELTDKVMSIGWQDYTAGRATEEKAKTSRAIDTHLQLDMAEQRGRKKAVEEMFSNNTDD